MNATVTSNPPSISAAEYAQRREAVMLALEGAVGIVLAGSGAPSDCGRSRTDRSFWYLTGLDHESGAAVLFDPSTEDPKRRITLFLRPRDPEMERCNGVRDPLGSALKAKTGFAAVRRTGDLPSALTEAGRRVKRLACLHPFAPYTADCSPDLDLFARLAKRIPGLAVEDRTQILPRMRAVKSPAELALIERAVAATAASFAAGTRIVRPGVPEREIADALTLVFRDQGSEPAFPIIVGSGLNGTVLHYSDNNGVVEAGELVVIDCGAAYGGYACDVSRTLPATGTFTAEQREVYEIVLAAQLAALAAAQPGTAFTDVDGAARSVIDEAGYEDYFIHGIGHQLGSELHDATPDGPLKVGMVITIEPGVYLPERGFGVRIEDDVLITETGNRNLTAAIPKTVAAIEAAMAGR